MALDQKQIDEAAQMLYDAEVTAKQTGLLSKRFPDMDMDDAYAVQAALIQHKINAGRTIIGRKIGLTSKAMQAALNIDIPDSGVLLDDMHFENGAVIPDGRFIEPRIEAEIAFVMKAELRGSAQGVDASSPISRDDVIAATDYVTPSLEILDTRILRKDPGSGDSRKIVDTISDNAANAGVVLGDRQHAIDAYDLRWVGAIVSRNAEVEETGLGAGVLNDPVTSVVWLANRLLQYGDWVKAGDIILSGSFIRPIEAIAGSKIHADFGDFGSVNCNF